MIRVAFNTGEISPEMAARMDVDAYQRGCNVLENWDLRTMGGLTRRRGMKRMVQASGENARLLPYIYSYSEADDLRFLVEVTSRMVRVMHEDGSVAATFRSNVDSPFALNVDNFRWKQVNKHLFLTCRENAPMVLTYDKGEWTFEPWAFKHYPWRYNHEERDEALTIAKDEERYVIDFPDDLPADERLDLVSDNDRLRASFLLEQAESGYHTQRVLGGVSVVSALPATARKGDKFAILGPVTYKCYVCIAEHLSTAYMPGMDSPADYPSDFRLASGDISEFDIPDEGETADAPYSIKGKAYAKGKKIRIALRCWEYWTCVKDFEKGQQSGTFRDFPAHFMSGVEASAALPCRGAWSFQCSGIWFGEYAVRRNMKTDAAADDGWEERGLSASLPDAASNYLISGDESDEECYLKLFVTKSRVYKESDLKAGFPADSCYNRLVVGRYKHDEVFKVRRIDDEFVWLSENTVQLPWTNKRRITDWSWTAFSERYGYPLLCELFASRLLFASTLSQPQTLWASRTDDLDNFLVGPADDASMYLTLNTTSQNPICWLMAYRQMLLLGTSEMEFAIVARGEVFANGKVSLQPHSYVGSSSDAALAADAHVLYIGRGKGRVFEYGYSLESDGMRSVDLSIFADHIARQHGGFTGRSALLRSPDMVALYVLGDGQLAFCVYNSMHNVQGWHRWITDGRILDVCVMPDGNRADKLYLLVSRSDERGVSTVSIETLSDDYVDEGGRDYVSTMVTNTLTDFMQRPMEKALQTPFDFCFSEDIHLVPGSKVELSCDSGLTWSLSPNNARVLNAGWKGSFVALNSNRLTRGVGLRVSGNQAFNLLAVQG